MKSIDVSGIPVSKIVLGTGGPVSGDQMMHLLDDYYEAGGRTVDTANMYDQLGESSESVIGHWLRSSGVRDSITLVSKGGFPRARMCADCLCSDIEQTLDRLGCTPDIYFLHRDRPDVPAGEFADIADSFVQKGYTRAWGVSNWDNDRIREIKAWSVKNRRTPPAVSQIQWSLAETTGELAGDDTLICMNEERKRDYIDSQMPLMAFASQAKGFFSKFAAGTPYSKKVTERFLSEKNLERAKRVKMLSEQLGVSAAAVALAYITCSRLNAAAVIGCVNWAQLADSMTAQDVTLTDRQVEWLEKGDE